MLNHHVLKFPTIGLLVISLTASLVVIGLDAVLPGPDVTGAIRAAVAEIDFYQTVMEGMLGFRCS